VPTWTTEAQRQIRSLYRLARLHGIQPGYTDALGNDRTASPEALLAVMRALGAGIKNAAEAPALVNAERRRSWHYHVEPSKAVWQGLAASCLLRVPAAAAGALVCSLTLESGEVTEWRVDLEGLAPRPGPVIDGERYAVRVLPLPALPPGYHDLHLKHAALEADVFLISAPRRAWEPDGERRWGVFAPLYALHSQGSWGAGDFSDLGELARWTHRQGGSFVATLPLLAMFLGDQSLSTSPYSPASRLFWNEFYVDGLKAAQGSPAAEGWLQTDAVQAEIRRLRGAPRVQYHDVYALKRGVIERAASDKPAPPPEPGSLLEEYALFRATHEAQGRPWRQWPERLRSGQFSPSDYDDRAKDFYLAGQHIAAAQLGELKADLASRQQKLYLDLPIGSHADGFDVWRFSATFAEGVSCGAPPDMLFTLGQDWGLPPAIPSRLRSSRFEFFRRLLDHHLQFADILRFDHIIGLTRLYWVAGGFPATEGVFVKYPTEELYAILSLESHRRRALIIGENLGTVPPQVNAAMRRHAIYETYVLQYELPAAVHGELREPLPRSLAGLNTHDMPTFAGYWAGHDIDVRERLGIEDSTMAAADREQRALEKAALLRILRERRYLPDGTQDLQRVRDASTYLLTQSAARLAVVNLEDLWLETETHNIPGTVEGNWERPISRPLDGLPDVNSDAPDAEGPA